MRWFLAFQFLLVGSAWAADPWAGASFKGDGSFMSVVPGLATTGRDALFKGLLGTPDGSQVGGPGLRFPYFPRTWHEQFVIDKVTTNTYYGLNLGRVLSPLGLQIGRFGGKVDIAYQYAIKTSLILILPHRTDPSDETTSSGDVVAPSPGIMKEMFIFDPSTGRTYPRVSEEVPMVAFCSFEASLAISQDRSKGVEFLGFGQSSSTGQVRGVSHTIYSRFFQVDGKLSVAQMRDELCVQKFRRQVQDMVEGDFARVVVEFYAYENQANQCRPRPGLDDSEGDEDCRLWMKKNFSYAEKMAVPRCVLQPDGIHRCQLRSKAGYYCPMRWDRRKARMVDPEVVVDGFRFPKATQAPFEFPCDEGYRCVESSAPRVLGGVPFLLGRARCMR